jgi:hypothetical protein
MANSIVRKNGNSSEQVVVGEDTRLKVADYESIHAEIIIHRNEVISELRSLNKVLGYAAGDTEQRA